MILSKLLSKKIKQEIDKSIIVNYNFLHDPDSEQKTSICVKGQVIPTEKQLDKFREELNKRLLKIEIATGLIGAISGICFILLLIK